MNRINICMQNSHTHTQTQSALIIDDLLSVPLSTNEISVFLRHFHRNFCNISVQNNKNKNILCEVNICTKFCFKRRRNKKKNERKILFVNSIHRICALRLIRKRLENESFQFKIQQTHTQKKHAHTHLIITRRVWFSFS